MSVGGARSNGVIPDARQREPEPGAASMVFAAPGFLLYAAAPLRQE